MITYTTRTYGFQFSEQHQSDGIYGYVDGGDYSAIQKDALAVALFDALREAVDARLPESVTWLPATSEFQLPYGGDMPGEDEMRELFDAAWSEDVEPRFAEIEDATISE